MLSSVLEMKVIVKKFEELTDSDLEIINRYRAIEFESEVLIVRPNTAEGSPDRFFLLIDNGEIRAFGKTEEMVISFQNKDARILKASTIVSIIKGQGFGKILMEAIKAYSYDCGKSLVGFCETSILPFYSKCGFSVINSRLGKFVFVDDTGNILKNFVPGEVFYCNGKDNLMSKIISAKNDLVLINLPTR